MSEDNKPDKPIGELNRVRLSRFLDQYLQHPYLSEETAQKVAQDMENMILDGLHTLLEDIEDGEQDRHALLFAIIPLPSSNKFGLYSFIGGKMKRVSKIAMSTWLRKQGIDNSEFHTDQKNCCIILETGEHIMYRHVIEPDVDTVQEVTAAMKASKQEENDGNKPVN